MGLKRHIKRPGGKHKKEVTVISCERERGLEGALGGVASYRKLEGGGGRGLGFAGRGVRFLVSDGLSI